MSPVHSHSAPAPRSLGWNQSGRPSFFLTYRSHGSSLVFERIPPVQTRWLAVTPYPVFRPQAGRVAGAFAFDHAAECRPRCRSGK